MKTLEFDSWNTLCEVTEELDAKGIKYEEIYVGPSYRDLIEEGLDPEDAHLTSLEFQEEISFIRVIVYDD